MLSSSHSPSIGRYPAFPFSSQIYFIWFLGNEEQNLDSIGCCFQGLFSWAYGWPWSIWFRPSRNQPNPLQTIYSGFVLLEHQNSLQKLAQMPRGWRDWFHRVSEKKARDWEIYDLNQCLTLSLSGMERNDSLLISASYFWSNTLNAFIFCHGPMTITLVDVYMLTGLRIIGSTQPYDFLSAGSKKLAKMSDCRGWAM